MDPDSRVFLEEASKLMGSYHDELNRISTRLPSGRDAELLPLHPQLRIVLMPKEKLPSLEKFPPVEKGSANSYQEASSAAEWF